MFGESRGQDRSRPKRRLDHLVLVRGGNRDPLAVDDAVAGRDVVDMPSDAPTLFGLLDPSAEHLGHQLVAEADPDHGNLARIGRAHEIFERRDPVELIVDAGRGAGDEDGLQGPGIGKPLAVDVADSVEMDRRVRGADHALEHLREGAEPGAGRLADQSCLDDGDAWHEAPRELARTRTGLSARRSGGGSIAAMQFQDRSSPLFAGTTMQATLTPQPSGARARPCRARTLPLSPLRCSAARAAARNRPSRSAISQARPAASPWSS